MSMFIDEWLEKLPAASGPPPAQRSAVVELDAGSFDDLVLYSGKPIFVDFYATFCKCTFRSSITPGFFFGKNK
jgi:hypothetical protein